MSQRPTATMIAARVIEYAGLAGLVSGSFLVVVLGGGAVWRLDPPHPGLTLAAAALLGASFEPARQRLRRLANRLVYGHRSSPWEAVRRLSVQMGSEPDPAELLRELSEVVRSGTGAAAVVVWLRIGGGWRPAAASPDRPESLSPDGPGDGGDELPRPAGTGLAVPIRHGGELLGAITMGKPAGGPVLPLERRLVTDLAAHAGIVTRTLHLRESRQRRLAQSRQQQRELVAARARLVAAHDAERRWLTSCAGCPGACCRRCCSTTGWPPRCGRCCAGWTGRSPWVAPPVDTARFPAPLETTAYLCCRAAVEAAGPDGAPGTDLRLWLAGGALAFSVSHAAPRPASPDLAALRDRVTTLGGELVVAPAGEWFTLIGTLPLPAGPAAGTRSRSSMPAVS